MAVSNCLGLAFREYKQKAASKREWCELAYGIEQGFQVKCKLEISEGVPRLINDSSVAAFLHEASASVLGSENVRYLEPIMGSEDFSYFTQARPGAIMRLGCANQAKGLTYPLHSPYFDIDESVLEIGVKVFMEAICRYLID